MIIGPHVTISKGFGKAAEIAVSIGANTFQFFSRNPRGGNAKEFNQKDLDKFNKIRKENNFGPILAHAPYTVNLGGTKDEVYEFAKRAIKEDIERMNSIGIEYICLHPGSHIGGGVEFGTKRIIEGLNEAINGDETLMLLLETMSGKGSEIGVTFEEIKNIIDGIVYKDRVGVCLDTCHIFSAGYDIVNKLDEVIEEFDRIIGLDKLKAIHLNDSMMPFASNKDRHAAIGEGTIGFDALMNFVTHEKLKHLPFYLETPLDEKEHKEEIEVIRNEVLNRSK
ncbi:MAG: deoxyribonuclease IV [Peptostreptococcaceae bacterium]